MKPATTVLDFVRYHRQLTGTKIGCREGDCGACSVLVGEIINDTLIYSSATSCLMPLGNAHKKHIVTIEGLNLEKELNGVQQAFANEGATQCGFCTPGFIVSLCGYCLTDGEINYKNAIDSVNGNICRCTGYKSIERAIGSINDLMERKEMHDPVDFCVEHKLIPPYFLHIKSRLQQLGTNGMLSTIDSKIVAGGTDMYVQQHDTITDENISLVFLKKDLKGITVNNGVCEMGAATTVSDMATSGIFQKHFPALPKYIKLVSSTQIRNMATIAGNFINASPIGDFSIFFLALDAQINFSNGIEQRTIPLRKLYKGYKLLDKKPNEYIEKISFKLPTENHQFNFEKVCKRTHLDIASVNSAICVELHEGIISTAGIAAGGVSAIPAYLPKSSQFLIGKKLSIDSLHNLLPIIQSEISPISDARGTADYKRLLLNQLVKAHFITLVPELENELMEA